LRERAHRNRIKKVRGWVLFCIFLCERVVEIAHAYAHPYSLFVPGRGEVLDRVEYEDICKLADD
jgi:hypothetical protein